jgi:hypothetical protein
MYKRLLPLIALSLLSGCRTWLDACQTECWGLDNCCGMRACPNPCDCRACNCVKPPLNGMGMAYDGSGSPCYRPQGPFWCWLPGPCNTCRDPWVYYFDTGCNSAWTGRHVSQNCSSPSHPPQEVVYVADNEGEAVQMAYDGDAESGEED